jgi:hypothetical protein
MLGVTLAPPQHHKHLTVYPLLDTNAEELSYVLMADALDSGTLEITEVGSGTVPELVADNQGDVDVLIVDGEQLIGAKQNRMTNRSIVIPARTKVNIPVSCMEAGRWRFTSRAFTSSPHYSPRVLAQAQGHVWSEIARYSTTMGTPTPTGALDEVFEQKSADLETWAKAFPLEKGQVGLIAFVGERPLGLDFIGSARLYARLHERVVSAYIMDALAAPGSDESGTADETAALAFIERAAAAPRAAAPTVGRGSYRVLAEDVLGGELEDQSRLVHLSSFPT